MSSIPSTFTAFRIHDDDDGYYSNLDTVSLNDLSEGEVTIQVAWSGINFKDALAATGKGKILRSYPLCGGIDVAGIVVESSSTRSRSATVYWQTEAGFPKLGTEAIPST